MLQIISTISHGTTWSLIYYCYYTTVDFRYVLLAPEIKIMRWKKLNSCGDETPRCNYSDRIWDLYSCRVTAQLLLRWQLLPRWCLQHRIWRRRRVRYHAQVGCPPAFDCSSPSHRGRRCSRSSLRWCYEKMGEKSINKGGLITLPLRCAVIHLRVWLTATPWWGWRAWWRVQAVRGCLAWWRYLSVESGSLQHNHTVKAAEL